MRPIMKSPISDTKFGEFLLDCMKLSIEVEKLAKEVDDMLQIKCVECHCSLTAEEIHEARQNNLKMDDVCCDKCWQAWIKDRNEEQKHPDEK